MLIDLAQRAGVAFAPHRAGDEAGDRGAARPGPRTQQSARCLGHRATISPSIFERLLPGAARRRQRGAGRLRRRHPRRLLPERRLRRRGDRCGGDHHEARRLPHQLHAAAPRRDRAAPDRGGRAGARRHLQRARRGSRRACPSRFPRAAGRSAARRRAHARDATPPRRPKRSAPAARSMKPKSLALLAAYGVPVVAASRRRQRGRGRRRGGATRLSGRAQDRDAGHPAQDRSAPACISISPTRPRCAPRGAISTARLGPRAIVARMMPKGVEIALGMVRDPQFGPLVTVGAGGVLIELLSDRRAALAPFGPAAARRLLDGLALRRLLDGYRGAPAVDIDASRARDQPLFDARRRPRRSRRARSTSTRSSAAGKSPPWTRFS